PLGVNVWRPRHRKRMHPVLVLQDMRCVEAVLPTRTGHETVIAAVVLSIPVTQITQLLFPELPIDDVPLPLRVVAGVTDPVLIEMDRRLLRGRRMRVLHGRVRPLIRDHTAFTELHLAREAVEGLGRGGVGSKPRKIDRFRISQNFHYSASSTSVLL